MDPAEAAPPRRGVRKLLKRLSSGGGGGSSNDGATATVATHVPLSHTQSLPNSPRDAAAPTGSSRRDGIVTQSAAVLEQIAAEAVLAEPYLVAVRRPSRREDEPDTVLSRRVVGSLESLEALSGIVTTATGLLARSHAEMVLQQKDSPSSPRTTVVTLHSRSDATRGLLIARALLPGHALHIYVPLGSTSTETLRLFCDSVARLLLFAVPTFERVWGNDTAASASPRLQDDLNERVDVFCAHTLDTMRQGDLTGALARARLACDASALGTRLPAAAMAQVASVLDQLEGSDRSRLAQASDQPHAYLCLGTCLLHSGRLVHGTLSASQHRLIAHFCWLYDVLGAVAARQPEDAVIWREVLDLDNSLSDQRQALLCIAKGSTIVCALLESIETHSNRSSRHGDPEPLLADPLLITEGKQALYALADTGLMSQLSACAGGSCAPAVTPAESFLPSSATVRPPTPVLAPSSSSSAGSGAVALPSSARRGSFSGVLQSMGLRSSRSQSSENLSEAPSEKGHKRAVRSQSIANVSVPSQSSTLGAITPLHAQRQSQQAQLTQRHRLTSGVRNVLFESITVDGLTGIAYVPVAPASSSCGPVHALLLDSFRRTIPLLRPLLASAIASGAECAEHGVLLSTSAPFAGRKAPKKSQSVSLDYWCVGRRQAMPALELFVCYHESVPQSMVELAFKAHFGL